jgi:hypothetical protein
MRHAQRQKDAIDAISKDDVFALRGIALTPKELEETVAPMGVGSLLLFCAFLGKSVGLLIELIRKGANVLALVPIDYPRALSDDAYPIEKGDNIIHILVKRRDAEKLAEILKIKYADGRELIETSLLTMPNAKNNPPMSYANDATKAILNRYIAASAPAASPTIPVASTSASAPNAAPATTPVANSGIVGLLRRMNPFSRGGRTAETPNIPPIGSAPINVSSIYNRHLGGARRKRRTLRRKRSSNRRRHQSRRR